MPYIGRTPTNAALTASDLADGIVTTAKIDADAVTDAKIADDVVGTEHLTANEVDTTALGADAVTGDQLADNAVNSEHYTDGSIDTAHIADANVTTAKIAADAITAAKIADDAISEEHLDATVITGMTALAAAPADTDEFLISDAGTLKRIDYSYIKGVAATSTAIIKGWVSFNGTSTVAITQSYNCSSITDNGTGSYSVNWSAGTGATGSNHASTGGGDLGGYNNNERVNVFSSGNNQSGVESWNGTTATDFTPLHAMTFGNGS